MAWGRGVRQVLAFSFLSIAISACAPPPTLHSIGDPLPSGDELAATIDTDHAGNANDFLMATFYRDPRTGDAAIWAYQMYSQEGRRDLLEVLQSRGWDVNTRSHESSYLPLRLAIESGSVPAVNSLLSVGAEPDRLLGQCSEPCMFCPEFSRYLCSSALSLVVLAGEPAMLQPVLRASNAVTWREVDHATGAIGEQITGDEALSVGIYRAFQVGRGEAFASAFIEAGYAEQVTIARNAHQSSVAAANASSPASGADASSGDGDLTGAGVAAAVGLGLGALLGGDMDVVSAADMASTVMGASGAMGAGDTEGDAVLGMAQGILGTGGAPSGGSAETEMMSFFLQTLSEAAAEGAAAETASAAAPTGASPSLDAATWEAYANGALRPAKVERDALVVQIGEFINEGDAAAALPLFESLNALPVPIDPTVDFYWGWALVEEGQANTGIAKLTRFAERTDTASPLYREALRLIARAKRS
jgi:hypothetical protein